MMDLVEADLLSEAFRYTGQHYWHIEDLAGGFVSLTRELPGGILVRAYCGENEETGGEVQVLSLDEDETGETVELPSAVTDTLSIEYGDNSRIYEQAVVIEADNWHPLTVAQLAGDVVGIVANP